MSSLFASTLGASLFVWPGKRIKTVAEAAKSPINSFLELTLSSDHRNRYEERLIFAHRYRLPTSQCDYAQGIILAAEDR